MNLWPFQKRHKNTLPIRDHGNGSSPLSNGTRATINGCSFPLSEEKHEHLAKTKFLHVAVTHIEYFQGALIEVIITALLLECLEFFFIS